jgi:hypothetical protein
MNHNDALPPKRFHHEKGVTYFKKETERFMFFGLTLFMFGWILLEKLGIL